MPNEWTELLDEVPYESGEAVSMITRAPSVSSLFASSQNDQLAIGDGADQIDG